MLSNLATYIFGASNNEETETNPSNNPHNVASPQPAPSKPPAPLSEGEEDWVVVEERPSHLTLGSLNESTQVPPGGSTGSSHTPSESGSEGGAPNPNPPAQQQLSRTDRRLATPFGSCSAAATTLAAVKAVRSAQKSKDKSKAKSLTSKALERRNKAVKSNQSKKQYHASLNLRPANGKQLKQC